MRSCARVPRTALQVPRNSLGLIYGRSGSGKTTLLQVLAGLCEQTAGSVHIHPSTGPAPPLAPLKPPSAPPSAAAPKQGAAEHATPLMSSDNCTSTQQGP